MHTCTYTHTHIHSMVLLQDGSVWATGSNKHGQLGIGSRADRDNFVQVLVGGAKTITAGGRHSMVQGVTTTGLHNDWVVLIHNISGISEEFLKSEKSNNFRGFPKIFGSI